MTTSKRKHEDLEDTLNLSSIPTFSPSKRQRADPDPKLWDMIASLPADQTQSLLYQACLQSSSISDLILAANQERIAAEAALPPVNFARYSQACWYTLNKKFAKLSSSKQFDVMGEICEDLSCNREAIMDLAGPDTRWETRRNALEVLRKICKSIMLCAQSQIRHEIMKDGMVLGEFAESMMELARGMGKDERVRYEKEGLYAKLRELEELCEADDMVGLQEIYGILEGEEDVEEELYDEETSETIASRLADPNVVSAFLNLTPNRTIAPLRRG